MYKRVLFIAILAISVAACKQDNSDLGQKKAALETLIKEQSTLNDKVAKLRKEIDELDSTARNQKKIKAVDVTVASLQAFRHFIEASALVESDQNTMVTAKQPGFVINNVLVKAGDNVSAGQLLCTVDNSTIMQSKASLGVQFELAKTAFQRQKNLWEKQIGSEIQYLQSKTQKEALEKQLDKTLVLTENVEVSDALKYHMDNSMSLTNNVFKVYSESYFDLVNEVRDLYNEGMIDLNEEDRLMIESDLGKKIKIGKEIVYLDAPYIYETETEEDILTEAKLNGKNVQLNNPHRT